MRKALMAVVFLLAVVAGVAFTALFSYTSAHAGSNQLVYICTDPNYQCTNGQELQVSDQYGNPIFSVPAYGGPAVYGDVLRDYPSGASILKTAPLTMSGDNPAHYYKTHPGTPACSTQRARWVAPDGDYLCVIPRGKATGTWVKALTVRLP